MAGAEQYARGIRGCQRLRDSATPQAYATEGT